MPAANGQFQLQDYVDELKARGFDRFSDTDLKTYINRGYFHIARRFRKWWEETSDTFSLSAGSFSVATSVDSTGELPFFKHLDKLYLTTPDTYRRRLRPLSDDEFYENWFHLDLTAVGNRGIPERYFYLRGNIYVLSPPGSTMTFTAQYHRRVAPLVNASDLPLTPPHLDEAILVAATIRCHKRSMEVTLAAVAQSDLDEFFDDILDDEEELMDERLERVSPDDTWL